MEHQPEAEINVICGYRTPWSNRFLRRRSSAVAKHSLHMKAMAIDIRVPGVETSRLRDAALALHRGGSGQRDVVGTHSRDVNGDVSDGAEGICARGRERAARGRGVCVSQGWAESR